MSSQHQCLGHIHCDVDPYFDQHLILDEVIGQRIEKRRLDQPDNRRQLGRPLGRRPEKGHDRGAELPGN